MNRQFYQSLADLSLSGGQLDAATSLKLLQDPDVELLPLLNAAFEVRKDRWGKGVSIHIINNAQNGHCPEDCNYCAQAKTSDASIEEYPIKPDDEILEEARRAYDAGAFRYCMVFSGRGPSKKRVERLAGLVEKIKATYPIEVCLSAGLLDDDGAQTLKAAGLDRLNHNLNTSEAHYPNICTSHTFEDRLSTLRAAQKSGISLCSGMITGMGETAEDVVEVATRLRELGAVSIPVNFLIPIPGTTLRSFTPLTPEYCLKILCLFRFLNPKSELRAAAGREIHLRQWQGLSLYPANSLFMEGYLNTTGNSAVQTLQMIKDGGFTINSTKELDQVLAKMEADAVAGDANGTVDSVILKQLRELRPSAYSPACA
jgi:biotin synthase